MNRYNRSIVYRVIEERDHTLRVVTIWNGTAPVSTDTEYEYEYEVEADQIIPFDRAAFL